MSGSPHEPVSVPRSVFDAMTRYLISLDNIKTILTGAAGAMTFGAYHQFNTNKMMELNNANEARLRADAQEKNDRITEEIQKENARLRATVERLEKREDRLESALAAQSKSWFW